MRAPEFFLPGLLPRRSSLDPLFAIGGAGLAVTPLTGKLEPFRRGVESPGPVLSPLFSLSSRSRHALSEEAEHVLDGPYVRRPEFTRLPSENQADANAGQRLG